MALKQRQSLGRLLYRGSVFKNALSTTLSRIERSRHWVGDLGKVLERMVQTHEPLIVWERRSGGLGLVGGAVQDEG